MTNILLTNLLSINFFRHKSIANTYFTYWWIFFLSVKFFDINKYEYLFVISVDNLKCLLFIDLSSINLSIESAINFLPTPFQLRQHQSVGLIPYLLHIHEPLALDQGVVAHTIVAVTLTIATFLDGIDEPLCVCRFLFFSQWHHLHQAPFAAVTRHAQELTWHCCSFHPIFLSISHFRVKVFFKPTIACQPCPLPLRALPFGSRSHYNATIGDRNLRCNWCWQQLLSPRHNCATTNDFLCYIGD